MVSCFLGMVLKCGRPNDLVYYRFDKNGKKVDECWVKTPDVTWTHDMVATEKLVPPSVILEALD